MHFMMDVSPRPSQYTQVGLFLLIIQTAPNNSSSINFFLYLPPTPYVVTDFDVASPVTLTLTHSELDGRYTKIGYNTCYTKGTDLPASLDHQLGGCVCIKEFKGQDCGIPSRIWNSAPSSLIKAASLEKLNVTYRWDEVIRRRKHGQRRLIHALPVNLEVDLFEARIVSLYDVVDVFLIGESNMTNSGGTRELTFLNMLKSGWLRPYQDKIVYVFRGTPPPSGFDDGAAADAYMRSHLTMEGLNQLVGVSNDDLFMYTDGDELPRPDLLQFLKLYDGWPQPVAFKYTWSIFGFFWQVDEPLLGSYSNPIPTVVTVGVLRDVYHTDSSLLRKAFYYDNTEAIKKATEHRQRGEVIDQLSILDAGWHCSWCFPPAGIRAKLLDAPNSDYPRYGDDRAKSSVAYIKRLIKNGIYFNLVRLRKKGDEMSPARNPDFAPPFIQSHPERYAHLLRNPYSNVSLGRRAH
jgi:beta-1,4-mannosyl-glycoprotein beta-1,4-N-acetylglucosaminyltransferase